VLALACEDRWLAAGKGASLKLSIHNPTAQRLVVRLRGGGSRWSPRPAVSGLLRLHVRWRAVLEGGGQAYVEEPVDQELAEDLSVEPRTTLHLHVPWRPRPPPRCLIADVRVRAELFPVAIGWQGEPERLATLQFGETGLWWVPQEIGRGVLSGDFDQLGRGSAIGPAETLAVATACAALDVPRTVDLLILSMAGGGATSTAAAALRWLTGSSLGPSAERWQRWWDSPEGREYAKRTRALPSPVRRGAVDGGAGG